MSSSKTPIGRAKAARWPRSRLERRNVEVRAESPRDPTASRRSSRPRRRGSPVLGGRSSSSSPPTPRAPGSARAWRDPQRGRPPPRRHQHPRRPRRILVEGALGRGGLRRGPGGRRGHEPQAPISARRAPSRSMLVSNATSSRIRPRTSPLPCTRRSGSRGSRASRSTATRARSTSKPTPRRSSTASPTGSSELRGSPGPRALRHPDPPPPAPKNIASSSPWLTRRTFAA